MPTLSEQFDAGEAATRDRIAARKADWRVGHVLYQVFVDRFAPSRRLDAKREHYAAPRSLRPWSETPAAGKFLPEVRNNEAELAFWGGDLDSTRAKLDYLQALGVDVLYLNPIFEAYSNHKYDAIDFMRVDPQYGTNAELKDLADDLHARGMKLMLDGVFNHMGRRAPLFQKAQADEHSPERGLFYFGEQYKGGYRSWRNHLNLPEINLENPAARHFLWESPDSVVQHYLRDIGIDGWRLDCSPDIGPKYLAELTSAAHAAKPGCAVIGECWNYPEDWLRCHDGIMNMHLRLIILNMVQGFLPVATAARAIERMVQDCGIEGLLRCHNVIDNHDIPRVRTLVADADLRRIAWGLCLALPGCPTIYYGSELGMEGGADPLNRAPMQWDLDHADNAERTMMRQLLDLRRASPALRWGDIRVLDSSRLLAFLRTTDSWRDTTLVCVNPTDEPVLDMMPTRFSRLMDAGEFICRLSGDHLTTHCGMVEAKLPPRSIRVYQTGDFPHPGGYSLYKRVP